MRLESPNIATKLTSGIEKSARNPIPFKGYSNESAVIPPGTLQCIFGKPPLSLFARDLK